MSQTLNGRAPIDTEAHVAAATLTTEENGTAHTNAGAAGAVVLTLPPAAAGLHYFFAVRVAQALQINPDGNDTISLPSTGVPGAAGKYLEANAIGETVHLACLGGTNWAVLGYTGTWTHEA